MYIIQQASKNVNRYTDKIVMFFAKEEQKSSGFILS